MDPTAEQHQQVMSSNETLESMLICTKTASRQVDNKKPRPPDEAAQKCPRCDSSNTKFCYYNNYSHTQPRYFCKSCKRYWTKGGTLRNVPVGGRCRKNNKRSSSSSSNSSASSKIRNTNQNHQLPERPLIASNHNHLLLPYESTDPSLAFATLQNGQLGFDHDHGNHHTSVLGNYSNNVHGSFLDTQRCANFLEAPPINNGLQNVYYYGEDHHYENVGNYTSHEGIGNFPYEDLMRGGSGGSSATSAVNVTIVKQDGRAEGCNASSEATKDDGDGGIMMSDDVDAIGRQSSWINEFGSSNWQGFLNSPLM